MWLEVTASIAISAIMVALAGDRFPLRRMGWLAALTAT